MAAYGLRKTLIAEYAVDVSLERNKKVIYTAPKGLPTRNTAISRNVLASRYGIHR